MIYIFGYKGNMAKRYKCILDYLEVPHCGHDLNEEINIPEDTTGIIVCTPTAQHYYDLSALNKLVSVGKIKPFIPILCEKPITKNKSELEDIKSWGLNLSIVNQYLYSRALGYVVYNDKDTSYNFFNHGQDGLIWDCISLIALAEKDVYLRDENPTWACMLNGRELSLSYMNESYISMIKRWLDGKHNAPIWEPHYEIFKALEGKNERINCKEQ